MSTAASDFAVVLDYEEVGYRIVAQCLLAYDKRETNRRCMFNQAHCSSDTRNSSPKHSDFGLTACRIGKILLV